MDHICNKLRQTSYFFNNIKHLFPKDKLIELYYAHFHSHMTYCINSWGPMLTNTQINKVYQVQKKILRYIENKPYITNYNKIHKDNKILKFIDIVKLEVLKFSYKLNNNCLNKSLVNFFSIDNQTHPYNTRNRNYAQIKKHKTNIFNKSIFNKAVIEWLHVPVSLKNNEYKTFINLIKNKLIDTY